MIELINCVRGSSLVLTAKTVRADFPPYRPNKRGIFIIWLTFSKYENTRAHLWVNIYKEFTFTVHNFHQFEKAEWNKLIRAEIKVRKYVLANNKGNAPMLTDNCCIIRLLLKQIHPLKQSNSVHVNRGFTFKPCLSLLASSPNTKLLVFVRLCLAFSSWHRLCLHGLTS